MSDDTIEIALVQYESEQRVGPVDDEQVSNFPSPSPDERRDAELLNMVSEEAARAGLTHHTTNSRELSTLETPHYGGFASFSEVWNLVIYAGPYIATLGVAAGGGAAFIRNSLGAMNEWRNLRGGRSIKIKINGKDIPIKDGATEADVYAAIEDAYKS